MRDKIKRLTLPLLVIFTLFLTGCAAFTHNNASGDQPQMTKVWSKKFDALKIDVPVDDISIKTADNFKITYKGKKKLMPSVQVKDGCLIIKKSMNKSPKVIGDQELIIEMPKKQLKTLSIKTDNSDVSIDDLRVDSGKIMTSNGDVDLNNLIAKSGMKVSSSNGDVSVKSAKLDGYNLNTSDGDIELNGKTHEDTDSLKVDSHRRNTLFIKTSEGDIRVNES